MLGVNLAYLLEQDPQRAEKRRMLDSKYVALDAAFKELESLKDKLGYNFEEEFEEEDDEMDDTMMA
jgi:hypothetical protein